MVEPETATVVQTVATNRTTPLVSLPEFWKGHVSGSNRGLIVIRLTCSGGVCRGAAVLHDHLFGVTTFRIEGALQGSQAQLQIREFRSLSFGSSLSGQVAVNFNSELTKASGTWDTDVASGTLEITAAERDGLRQRVGAKASWWQRRLAAGLVLRLPLIYCAALLAVLTIDLFKLCPGFSLSTPDLIIALLPAPLLLQRHVSRLLVLFGVESVTIGPLQLAAPRVPLRGDLFASLDRFFILQTKILLIWLVEKGQVPLAQVGARAREIGAALFPTVGALVASGCAIIDGQNMSATSLGRVYADHVVPLTSIPKS